MVHPAGLPPANSPFEAEDDNSFTTDAVLNAEFGMRNENQNSPLLADPDSAFRTLHFALELVGRLGIAPSLRRVRAGTSLAKFATLQR
jgi:hypothetical protein